MSIKKAILKRTADVLEKIAVAGMVVGLFQGKALGIVAVGLGFLAVSYLFTIWEAKQ